MGDETAGWKAVSTDASEVAEKAVCSVCASAASKAASWDFSTAVAMASSLVAPRVAGSAYALAV
jgi:hypothetical protein